MEQIKEELSQQIEGPYKNIVHQLEQALQVQKINLEKLQNENQILRSNCEREKSDCYVLVDQLKFKQDIELNMIRQERDSLRLKLQENNQGEINKIKEAMRENNQLKIRVKALNEENEELREKLDRAESNNNLLMRNHSKFLTENSTKHSVLEVVFFVNLNLIRKKKFQNHLFLLDRKRIAKTAIRKFAQRNKSI